MNASVHYLYVSGMSEAGISCVRPLWPSEHSQNLHVQRTHSKTMLASYQVRLVNMAI